MEFTRRTSTRSRVQQEFFIRNFYEDEEKWWNEKKKRKLKFETNRDN